MLPFLLPNSVFSSRTTTCVPRGLSSLARRQQGGRQTTASTSRSFADNAGDYGDSPGSAEASRKQGEHVRWLLGQGQKFRLPNENGPNWLGDSVPFPMNPSFKPPTPISNKVRTQIFNLHMDENVGELELSSLYGLGVSRIKAILRLKKLEQLWIKNRVCQRRFQTDMERYLGVAPPSTEPDRPIVKDRRISDKIDVDGDMFSIGKSQRLQRVFFEVVPEGEYPPLAQYMDLEEAVVEENGKRGASEKAAARAATLAVVPVSTEQRDGTSSVSATRYKWFYPTKGGRAPHTFVDVGHRYLQQSDHLKEEKARHNSEAKAKAEDHRRQLGQALEAKRIRLSIERERLDLLKSKATKIRDKRQNEAEQEQALARSKVVDVDITL